jgi:hypothetical protein
MDMFTESSFDTHQTFEYPLFQLFVQQTAQHVIAPATTLIPSAMQSAFLQVAKILVHPQEPSAYIIVTILDRLPEKADLEAVPVISLVKGLFHIIL